MCRPNQTIFETRTITSGSDFGSSMDLELEEALAMVDSEERRLEATKVHAARLLSPLMSPVSDDTDIPNSSIRIAMAKDTTSPPPARRKLVTLSDLGSNTVTYMPTLYSPRSKSSAKASHSNTPRWTSKKLMESRIRAISFDDETLFTEETESLGCGYEKRVETLERIKTTESCHLRVSLSSEEVSEWFLRGNRSKSRVSRKKESLLSPIME
jgi:hypothetical protein